MRSNVPTTAAKLAVLAAPSLLSLVLLAAAGAAAAPIQRAALPDAASRIAAPSLPQPLELAGNRRRDNDDNFDPYGKDDPTNKKWGASAGMGNRYGGLNTGAAAKPREKKDKNADREERESRQVREEE